MLRVSTIYGYGKYAQITLVTTAVVNPVLDLNVKLVDNTKNVVHLSWKAPSNTSGIQVRNIELISPYVKESGFQNLGNFCLWNPESGILARDVSFSCETSQAARSEKRQLYTG